MPRGVRHCQISAALRLLLVCGLDGGRLTASGLKLVGGWSDE